MKQADAKQEEPKYLGVQIVEPAKKTAEGTTSGDNRKPLREAVLGDELSWGKYRWRHPRDDSWSIAPENLEVSWKVLAREKGYLLLISTHVLDWDYFFNFMRGEKEDFSWKASHVRQRLKSIETVMFSEDERSCIPTSAINRCIERASVRPCG